MVVGVHGRNVQINNPDMQRKSNELRQFVLSESVS